MGTLTISGAGFATLGATPPANWPANVTFPANGNPNGTKTYTVSDADWLRLLTWMATNQQPQIENVLGLSPPITFPLTPTAAQILLAWLQIWINGTKNAVQSFETPPAVIPTQINVQ